MASPPSWACQAPNSFETFCGVMREEYSDRKLFFGMALRPQKRPSPSSATSAMTWLLRSTDHSLRASAASNPCSGGIICEPENPLERRAEPVVGYGLQKTEKRRTTGHGREKGGKPAEVPKQ